ncbi:hypothetical protein EG329_011260 [Mollisiaceae sp. DMI_Dod_QoI]|nr:hypothetical protein EG329_011260 [Helotiales sp. DMI_Dod_QoI]
MPCRRPHRKSRLGCKNCKVKRTKCDEIHPTCGNCHKYNLQCDFTLKPRSKSPPTVSLPPVKIPPLKKPLSHYTFSGSGRASQSSEAGTLVSFSMYHPSQDPRSSLAGTEVWTMEPGFLGAMTINTPQDRLLELKLMYHFTTIVSTTLFRLLGTRHFQEAYARDAYSKWVTNLAVSHPGLMDALLGFSAFNLRKLEGGDKDLSLASHKYMTTAIKAHSQELSKGINDQNAEILFAGSSLIAFVAVSSHEYLSAGEDEAELPLHWFQPWQGVRSIVKVSWDFIHTEAIVSLLESERRSFHDDFAVKDQRSTPFDFLLEDLDRSTVDPETLDAYESSVYWLSLIQGNPDMNYCFKFTAKVPPKFVQMLTAKDPRTLTIVGYFFMVLKVRNEVWWLPRSTGREFRNLMRLLPDEWKPRMALAVEAFEGL